MVSSNLFWIHSQPKKIQVFTVQYQRTGGHLNIMARINLWLSQMKGTSARLYADLQSDLFVRSELMLIWHKFNNSVF